MRSFFSEHAFAAPVGFSRLFATIAFLAVGISMAPAGVRGQTTACKELVADMAAQQKMIGIFRTLDYEIRTHFLIVANAILSTYGGWNSKPDSWGNDAGKLRDSKGSFELRAVVIRRDMSRSDAISEDESQRLNSAIDNFLGLIETGDQIAKEIDDGRVDDANQIYFETARPNYMQVHGTLYTLIITAERRVASMARTPCS